MAEMPCCFVSHKTMGLAARGSSGGGCSSGVVVAVVATSCLRLASLFLGEGVYSIHGIPTCMVKGILVYEGAG